MPPPKVYTTRETSFGFVAPAVLRALDQPDHVRQARILIVAAVKADAADLAAQVRLGVHAAKLLAVATGDDVDTLHAAGLTAAPAVYVVPLNGGGGYPLVRIGDDGEPTRIGTLTRDGTGRRFTPGPAAAAPTPAAPVNPAAYRMGWTRRIDDDLVTLWLDHDRCEDSVGGWDDTMPTLAELNTAAAIHGLTCPEETP